MREKATAFIHELVRRHIDGTDYRMKESAPSPHRRLVEELCREIAELEPRPETARCGLQPICNALTAIHHAHKRWNMHEEEAIVIRTFLDAYSEMPYQIGLRDETIRYAFVLLPDTLQHPILDDLGTQAEEHLERLTEKGYLSSNHVAGIARFLSQQPTHTRRLPRPNASAL
jgi:hypothetical protein